MKVVLAFAFMIAAISAVPPVHKVDKLDVTQGRIIGGAIQSAIEAVAQAIRDAGLDPLHIKREESAYALPVPVIFNYDANVEDMLSTGLSNIVVHRVNYNVITSRLNFDVEMPLIHASVGKGAADIEMFGKKQHFSTSGKIEIARTRVTGQVRVNIGIISGISIRSISIDFSIGNITSDVNLTIFGEDVSDLFNGFVSGVIPTTLKDFKNEINELLQILLLDILNDIL